MRGNQRVCVVCGILLGIFLFSKAAYAKKDSLRVGITPYKNNEELEKSYGPLLKYVGEVFGLPIRMDLVTGEELQYALYKGEYDIGIFKPFDFLSAQRLFDEFRVFGSHVIAGSDHYKGGIVVKKSSNIQSLKDLAGKEFLFVKPRSTSGFRYPKGILKSMGISLNSLLSGYAGSHETALRALANDEIHGISIDLSTFDSLPEIDRNDFRVLQEYDVPYPAYVFSPELKEKDRKKLRSIFLEAHKNVAQTQVLFQNPLGIQAWIEKEDVDYNSLRRILDFSRIKPRLGVDIDFSKELKKKHKDQDVLSSIEDDIYYDLGQAELFRIDNEKNPKARRRAKVKISYHGDRYRIDVYANSEHLGSKAEERIMKEFVSLKELQEKTPAKIARAILSVHFVTSSLQYDDREWFIPYGTEDHLESDNYQLRVLTVDGEYLTPEIDRVEEKNTYFVSDDDFEKHQDVEIRFKGAFVSAEPIAEDPDIPWWNDRDKWDIFGVILAIITIIAGAYFSRRKRRNFQSMLYESNSLLKEYVADTYNLENRLIEQKEKISQSLAKGYISENQFLILKHRLEDIEMVVHSLLHRGANLPEQVETEIASLLNNHQLTEKEYSRIISLVKKNAPKTDS